MSICTPDTLCDLLRAAIRGEAGDPNQIGIVQITTVDPVHHRAVLLGVGRRAIKGGAITVFQACPYCGGKLPVYPKPSSTGNSHE